jgi:hypothetical protein
MGAGFGRATPETIVWSAAALATSTPAAAAPAASAAPAAAGACPVVSQPSSASANDDAELQRFAGSRASARWSIAASSSGIVGRTVRGSGVGPLNRASATDAALSPSHGRCPVSIS